MSITITDEFIAAAGVRFHVRSAGNANGMPLVFLHGWPEDATTWDRVACVAAEDGYACFAPDLPGIGESRPAPATGSKAHVADLVHELVRELGLTEVTLVGQDVGGMIAFSYLRRFPARAAVIMNTVIPGVDPWDDVIRNPWLWHFAFHSIPELPERLVSADRGAYFDYFFDAIAASPESIDHAARARYADAYESPEALHQGFEFYRALWSDARENQTHVAVAAPLLYLRGSHERGDIDAYAGGLARSGFTSVTTAHIEGAGHFAPEENPRAVWSAIRAFVA